MGKTKTITHVKTFQTSQFHFDKIGLEDTFPSEKPDIECIQELSERIGAMAKELYPWVFANGSAAKVLVPYGMVENIEIPIIPSKREVEQEEAILDKILHSETIKELKSWKILITVEKDPNKKFELNSAYDMKMKELTSKETV